MSHWQHTMVNGAKFWISYQQLAFLSSFGRWQLIQNLAPYTIVWRQCHIQITALSVTCSCMLWNITRNECIPKVNYGLATLSTAFKVHWKVQIDSSQFKNKHWTKFGKLLLQPTKLLYLIWTVENGFKYCHMDRHWCHWKRPLKTCKWKFERSFLVICTYRSCKYWSGLSRVFQCDIIDGPLHT